jgi:secreted trypsin-like serine protease
MFRAVVVLAVFSVAFGFPSTETARHGRIVGGQKAREGQFPYMVSLRASFRPYEHGCGGFIINSRWIGSVAHCTMSVLNHMLTVAVVGTITTSEGGTTYRFKRWYNHPEHIYYERRHDIGLGRTRSEIVFTSLVQPIPLGSEFVGAGVKAIISGWGTPDYPLPIGQFTEDLYWLELTTITNEECIERTIPEWRFMINPENICTYDGPGIGACNGDSGSPLTAGGFVIGAVAWALPCARDTAEVYPRISSYRSWMLDVIARNP